MKLFGGNKYHDDQLVNQAMTAISNDPLIRDPATLVVTSKNGVVMISGIVYNNRETDRIEGVVRNAFTTIGLKHERIVNELKLSQTAR